MHIFILLLLISLLSSCHSSKREINDFDVVEKILVYDSIYSDKENPSGMIMDMEVSNGVIVTSHRNDVFNYSFIDSRTGGLLARWGKKGEGDNEFLDFGNGFVLKDTLLVFMERMKKTINYVPVSEILNGKPSLNIVKEPYPYGVDFRPIQFCLVNNNKVFVGAFKKGRLGMLDSRGDTLSSDVDYPFSTKPLEGIFCGNVFQCKLKSVGRHGKFVVQTLFSDVFEIYQYVGTTLKRTAISPFNHPPQIVQRNNRYGIDYDESIAGFMKMSVSDDFIYFIYSSLSSNEVDGAGEASNEILCFNWDGERIRKYILPFPISAFCVDGLYMYGVHNSEEESVIYRFRL